MRGRTSALWPYLLIAPAVAGGAFLLLYPLLKAAVISFQHFRMGELIRGGAALAGLDNYAELLAGEEFWRVLGRIGAWTAINVVLIVTLSTGVALMLGRLRRGLRLALMSALALAWATPIIAATTVFQWLFQSELGVVHWLLVTLGLDSFRGYTWFADGTATFAVLVVLVVWQSVPFAALTLYAGLTTIPEDVFEAARIDGAGAWRTFRSVTAPLLKPVFLILVTLSLIWDLKVFTQVYVITRGGPDRQTVLLNLYTYNQGFGVSRFGLAAAAAVITVAITGLLTAWYVRTMVRTGEEDL